MNNYKLETAEGIVDFSSQKDLAKYIGKSVRSVSRYLKKGVTNSGIKVYRIDKSVVPEPESVIPETIIVPEDIGIIEPDVPIISPVVDDEKSLISDLENRIRLLQDDLTVAKDTIANGISSGKDPIYVTPEDAWDPIEKPLNSKKIHIMRRIKENSTRQRVNSMSRAEIEEWGHKSRFCYYLSLTRTISRGPMQLGGSKKKVSRKVAETVVGFLGELEEKKIDPLIQELMRVQSGAQKIRKRKVKQLPSPEKELTLIELIFLQRNKNKKK